MVTVTSATRIPVYTYFINRKSNTRDQIPCPLIMRNLEVADTNMHNLQARSHVNEIFQFLEIELLLRF